MKILFVTDQLKFGGAERHLVALATGLAAHGHQVAVASLKGEDELGGELARGGVHRVLCCHSRGGLDVAAVGRLARIADGDGIDLIVATSQYSLMFSTLARLRMRRRPSLAFICHSMGVVQRGSAARLRFVVYRQFYGKADSVIFVSELQRSFFAAMGIKPAHSEVVHNGIDLQRFHPDAVVAEAALQRLRYGFAPGELVIGLCGVFREEKRQADLLEALALLKERGLPARVLLVGDGPTRPEIEATRARLGLGKDVVLTGFQDDVRPCIALCDVMALTSHTETFPMATLEYMAFAKPLVASDVGGLREQVTDGRNGLLYPAGDIGALAAALARCADPSVRSRLGQAALDTVRNRFDVTGMVLRYEQIFTELVPAMSR